MTCRYAALSFPSHNKSEPMLDTVIRGFRVWKKYRQTRSELSRLSERELDDLGLTRCDTACAPCRSLR